MLKRIPLTLPAVGLLVSLGSAEFAREPVRDPGTECAQYAPTGWLTIFDGTQPMAEKYWWISNASHGNGGNWWVDADPALVTAGKLKAGQKILWSNQNPGGNGGLLYTMRKYKDVEFMVSTFPGWRNDGGIFLRANGRGAAWQVMMDYQPGKTVGGIWPEGLQAPSQDIYRLDTEEKVTTLSLAKWNAADWPSIWDPNGFNVIYARVTGPNNGNTKIKAWITDSNHVVTDYTGTRQSVLGEDGHIGLQIHAGEGSWQGGPNKYKWMKIRELDPATGRPVCGPGSGPGTPDDVATGISDRHPGKLAMDWTVRGGGSLRLSGTAEADYRLILSDAAGRVLYQGAGKAGPLSHTFHGLGAGVYVARIAMGRTVHSYRAVRH